MNFSYQTAFVTLAATNFEELLHFYAQLFALAPNSYIPNRYAEFILPGLKLSLFKPKATHELEFAQQKGGMSLCIEVNNLEAAIAHLSVLGYAPPGEISTASHGREIYAYDPAGNRLILHESVAKIQ